MEGWFHNLLKQTVSKELKREGYTLYVEPIEPPLERLWWDAYQPDLLGIVSGENHFKLVFVECETNPRRRRILEKTTKIRQTLTLQTKLNERHLIRSILAIPTTTLNRINYPKIRRFWEIWIITHSGEIMHKIPNKV